MNALRVIGVAGLLLLAGCPEKKADPAIDVCQVNVDCTLVQLDECCARSTCDSDLRAETSARTQHRLEQCAKKDCAKSTAACTSRNPRVGGFCREGKCVVEKL